MRSGLILAKYPGKLISDNFLLEAVTTHPTAIGFALAKDGAVIHNYLDPATCDLLDSMQKVQLQYKDELIYFHLTKADEGEFSVPESLQPFPIITKGKNTELAVMVEGEFLDYVKPGETTPESHMVNDYLKAKVETIYNENGKNLNTTLTKLDSAGVRADFKPHLRPRGVILFIPAKGKSFAMTDNKIAGEYSWGFASKNLGIPTDIVKEEPVKPIASTTPITGIKKPLSFADRIAAKKNPPAVVEEPKKEEQKPVTAPVTTPAPSDGKIPKPPAMVMQDGVWWCKASGMSWDEAKKFWGRHTALQRPKLPADVHAGFPASALRASSPFKAFYDQETASTAIKDALEKAKETKTLKANAAVDEEIPGLLTAEEKKENVNDGKNGNLWGKLADEIRAMIQPTSLFSTQTQMPFNKLLYASMRYFMRRGKRELILIAHEFRLKIMDLEDKVVQLETELLKYRKSPPTVPEAPVDSKPEPELKGFAARIAAKQKAKAA